MKKSITQFLVVAVLVGSLIGCSSLHSMTQGSIPRPYSGASDAGQNVVSAVQPPDGWELTGMMVLPLFLVDFAASAAADTILLPVTFTKSVFFADTSQHVTQNTTP